MKFILIISLILYIIFREIKYKSLNEKYENIKKGIPDFKIQLDDVVNQFESFKNSINLNTLLDNNKNEKQIFEDKILNLTSTSKSVEQYFFYLKGDSDNYVVCLNYSKISKGTKIICGCKGYKRGYICKHIIWLFKSEYKIIFGKENLEILNSLYNKDILLPILNKLENIRYERKLAWKQDGKRIYEYLNIEEQDELNIKARKLIGHESDSYRSTSNSAFEQSETPK